MRAGFATLLGILLALLPTTAHAHAAIVSSQPAPGQQLASTPGVVSLRFSEPMHPKLSRATVTDPTGRQFSGVVSGDQEMRVRVSTNAVGIYQVAWKTVGTLDGHTLQGGFQFGVGVSAGGGHDAEVALGLTGADYLVAAARAAEYGGLLVATGMVLLAYLARRGRPLTWVRPRLSPPLALALLSGLTVVLGETYIAASSLSPGALADYLRTGLPGIARAARIVAEAYALSIAVAWPSFVAVPLVAAVANLAAAGHAAASRPLWWGLAADSLHLIMAGLWAGGILALATLRPPGGWRGAQARALLDRFTPVALLAFVGTVAFGLMRALQEVGDPRDLLASSYGQVLGAKGVAVLTMAALSLLAWRRRLLAPRLESLAAVAVIGAAALLAAHPLPPGRVREAEAARGPAALATGLPGPTDLTLGGQAGEVLVALTIRPGQPGPNEAIAYVLPVDGERAAAALRAQIAVDGRLAETKDCGSTCRSARVELRGGESLEVRIAGPVAGTAIFDLPPLPAREGDALLSRMRQRMQELRTVRIDETLGPVQPPSIAVYELQAPDRLRYQTALGTGVIWIGEARWIRDEPDGPWRGEETSVRLPVPTYVWDPVAVGEPAAAWILGKANLEGVETEVLSFFAGAGSLPVWFRAWVDADGLARRVEMRAHAHFMDQRFRDFDAPFVIEPPTPL